jgi:hypothetical protein
MNIVITGYGVAAMQRKNRNLKVVKSFTQNSKASLCLTGRWLEQAGFTIDMRVDVIVKEKCLVIVPSDAGQCQRDGLTESSVA